MAAAESSRPPNSYFTGRYCFLLRPREPVTTTVVVASANAEDVCEEASTRRPKTAKVLGNAEEADGKHTELFLAL